MVTPKRFSVTIADGETESDQSPTGHDSEHCFHSCMRKVAYGSIIQATRQAYVLSELRGLDYEPYHCDYCGCYHVGKRPPSIKEMLVAVIKSLAA